MSPAQSLSSSFGVFGAAKEIIPSGRAMRAYTRRGERREGGREGRGFGGRDLG